MHHMHAGPVHTASKFLDEAKERSATGLACGLSSG